MKNFQKFLEANIEGNPGIPGEGTKKPGEPNYIDSVKRRAMNRLNLTDRDISRMGPRGPIPSRKEMELGPRMMPLLSRSIELSNGKEAELSQLATDVIYNLYKELIDRYEIELDIKMVKPGKVKDFMDEESEDQDEPPQEQKITDEDIIKEIHKRKLANLIIQGEAKNTKHLLHMEEVKDGLNEILGESKGGQLFRVLDELAKTADQLDWIIPEEFKAQMMEEMPDGLAGACSVGWKPKEKPEEDEDEEDEYKEPEYTEEENDEEQDDVPTENFGSIPVLRARGVDFSMLLHEAVKGLFEILSLGGIPEDERVSKLAIANTGMSDEPQDFKYGPEIASDLRDFINVNTKVDTFPNIREELWKVMIDKESMPTDQFLELMRGILAKTPKARRDVDYLIDKVIKMIKDEKEGFNQYNKEMDEYERDLKDFKSQKEDPEYAENDEPESDIDKLVRQSLHGNDDDDNDVTSKKDDVVDYKSMTPKELQAEIDAALDNEDYAKLKMLSEYMPKESKKIYLRELEIINERLNPHIK